MTQQTVRCPRCNKAQKHTGSSDSLHYCCGGYFDDSDPNEGGDYSDRNPAARLEREERQQQREKERRARR